MRSTLRNTVLFSLAIAISACGPKEAPPETPPPPPTPVALDAAPVPTIEATTFATALKIDLSKMTKTPEGLYYQDQVIGKGAEAVDGKTFEVFYTLYLPDGTMLQSNVNDQPFSRTLGGGGFITGWQVGLQGMKEGGKRLLVVPGHLGYGAAGMPPEIKPHQILVFVLELKSLK